MFTKSSPSLLPISILFIAFWGCDSLTPKTASRGPDSAATVETPPSGSPSPENKGNPPTSTATSTDSNVAICRPPLPQIPKTTPVDLPPPAITPKSNADALLSAAEGVTAWLKKRGASATSMTIADEVVTVAKKIQGELSTPSQSSALNQALVCTDLALIAAKIARLHAQAAGDGIGTQESLTATQDLQAARDKLAATVNCSVSK